MRSGFYLWLVEVEDAERRMIRGVFRFVVEGLPAWLYHVFIESVGPVAVRICRVSCLSCLWLMILFGPFALACQWGLHGWLKFFTLAWVGVAIAGSLWGLNHVVKNRKAGF